MVTRCRLTITEVGCILNYINSGSISRQRTSPPRRCRLRVVVERRVGGCPDSRPPHKIRPFYLGVGSRPDVITPLFGVFRVPTPARALTIYEDSFRILKQGEQKFCEETFDIRVFYHLRHSNTFSHYFFYFMRFK